jgi:hypothetical protein
LCLTYNSTPSNRLVAKFHFLTSCEREPNLCLKKHKSMPFWTKL